MGGETVSALEESLREIMAIDGAHAAALVDIATGMVVRSGGPEEPALPLAAALLAEEAQAAWATHGAGQPGGDLEEIALLTPGRLHLSRVLSSRPGEGLVLFVDFDRAHVNPALAALQLSRLAPAVLA